MHRLLLLIALVASLAAFPASALADDPPPGSEWEETYIDSGDPLIRNLHADILRPKDLPKGAKAPVIVTVSPYTGHGGQQGVDYNPARKGPSPRFYDFLEVGKVFERGYIYVMVDLPGFGGSDGCNDWGGPVEQKAVKVAVEWAASQEWSNGKVGLIGKSYDGWTGLMGIAQKPKGLSAVVSQEPVYSGYRYLYMNGVRFLNSAATPALFTVIDAQPGTPQDDPTYNVNGAPKGYCYPMNIAQQQQDTEESAFWAERNLLTSTKGSSVPLFLTQGFLETNTKQDGAFDVFNGMTGPKRGWFGQFDHVRGWEGCKDGECLMGKADFADQTMRFFGHHLKGDPLYDDATVEVQSAPDGRWRAEQSWPPADSATRLTTLKPGTYTDDGENQAYGSGAGNGIWSVSAPLPHRAWFAGEPVLSAKLSGVPRANFVANVYDIAPDNKATMVSRGAWLMRSASEDVSFKLYGQDWVFEPGHRVGVLLSSANSDWWTHAPTNADVTVDQATIALPWLTYERTEFLPGQKTGRLESHLGTAFDVDPTVIEQGATAFDLPPALLPVPKVTAPAPGTKLTAKAKYNKRKRTLTVSGAAPAGSKVTVTVKKGKRRVARKSTTAKSSGRYAVALKLRKRGRYTVTVRSGGLGASFTRSI
jgi:predicted acyl esterase